MTNDWFDLFLLHQSFEALEKSERGNQLKKQIEMDYEFKTLLKGKVHLN